MLNPLLIINRLSPNSEMHPSTEQSPMEDTATLANFAFTTDEDYLENMRDCHNDPKFHAIM